MDITTFNSEAFCGYKQITTFFQDFSIADNFGIEAVMETYENGFKYAKTNYKVLTEFVMVLNWKIWQHYETNVELAMVYNSLWKKAELYATSNLKGEELSYFYRTID